MIDKKEYSDLGITIAELAKKAEKKLEEVAEKRELPPIANTTDKESFESTGAVSPGVDFKSLSSREISVLVDATHTLEERIHDLEVVIEGLRKERSQLMGRIRALNAMLERSRRAQ